MRRTVEDTESNPFVVLSDVTIAMLLMLILYFAALFTAYQRQITEAGKEKDPKPRLIAAFQDAVTSRLWNSELSAKDKRLIGERRESSAQYFTFPESALFETGESELAPKRGGAELLERFGKALGRSLQNQIKTVEGRQRLYPEIQVQGHTDSSSKMPTQKEKDEQNWELSGQRALNVLKRLRLCKPLKEEKLSLAGYAYFQPTPGNPNRLGADQPPNRRVEIRLLYDIK